MPRHGVGNHKLLSLSIITEFDPHRVLIFFALCLVSLDLITDSKQNDIDTFEDNPLYK